MPRHLISDAHEWINEIPTVPIYYLAKSKPRKRAWRNQRGKKTLLSLTLVRFGAGEISLLSSFLYLLMRRTSQSSYISCPCVVDLNKYKEELLET